MVICLASNDGNNLNTLNHYRFIIKSLLKSNLSSHFVNTNCAHLSADDYLTVLKVNLYTARETWPV